MRELGRLFPQSRNYFHFSAPAGVMRLWIPAGGSKWLVLRDRTGYPGGAGRGGKVG
jgi:hypothetical protein